MGDDLPQPLHAGDFYLRAILEELRGLRDDVAALSVLVAPRLTGGVVVDEPAAEDAGVPQEATQAATAPAIEAQVEAAERPAASPPPPRRSKTAGKATKRSATP